MKIEKLEQLNEFAVEVEAKMASIQEEAVKKGDVELVSKANADLKVELEATQKALADIKDNIKYEVASKTETEKFQMLGSMILSIKSGDFASAQKYGVTRVTTDWETLAAPDIGTPIRGDATPGSYLIPEELASQILRTNPSPSALMGKVTSVPMSTRAIKYPTLVDTVSWTKVTDETTAKTETLLDFSHATLTAATYAFFVAFTEELREDSVVNIGQLVAQLGTEKWQYTFDDQFLNTATTGLLNVAGTNPVAMGAGKTAVANFSYAEAQKVPAALTTQAKRIGAAWLMHQTVEDVLRGWKDDNGRPYYVESTDSMPGKLMGYPIFLSDAMPDESSVGAGDAFAAFGPMNKLLHGNRVGLQVKYFDQTADSLIYDREFIRLRTRQAFTVPLPDSFAILSTASA